jgi:pyruvate/2-oxoglutarate dehydrogenase complex dihydrolipoamide dehydrogenase (E3) component/uncharacterized membrane protein YdjX (TVP38/TMEM64 family)
VFRKVKLNEKIGQSIIMKKNILLVTIIALVIVYFKFDIDQLLTLQNIKDNLIKLEYWYQTHPALTGILFFILYIGITALSLPGAAIMTMVSGAIFGLFWGTLIASFASSIGATIAFLTSRYLLKSLVEERFKDRLRVINSGIQKDGAFYLFSMRLVPAFPFFLINILMGLTSIRTFTFYWVSQIGMFAGTLVFVNAGTQIANINDMSGILSPSLLLSFALLGIFPLIAKKVLSIMMKKKAYSRFKKPKFFDRNLIVIGAGAGGLVSSYIAAAVNAKVTLIEAHKMGGDCLNYGCVPSKALIRSAKVVHLIRNAPKFGLDSLEPTFSFKKIIQRVHEVIAKIEPHDSIERYQSLGVEVIQGYAKLVDPWTVEISRNDGELQRLTSRSIVLATGARPFVPPLPGINDVDYLTSDNLWSELINRDKAPARLVVLGGGPIGCELAQSFARLGSKVVQVEKASRIMIREDEDVSKIAKDFLEKDGVCVLTSHTALRIVKKGNKQSLIVEFQGEEKVIEFDTILIAVGRVARLDGYGLEELGIKTDRNIVTNEYLETLFPNIYAIGDVAGPYQFTHVASHQAWYATVNALFGRFKKFKVDYRVIPWTTFLDPEVARVGLNEQDAKEKGIDYEVTRYEFKEFDRALADGSDYGFVKVLTPRGKDKIIGVTIVGDHGGDLIAEFVLAMKHGLGLNKILATVHAYPTWAEANKYTAGAWKRSHAPEKILQWLKKYHSWARGS